MNELDDLRAKLRAFATEREWERFHSPKNLAMALAAESGELLEVFQWLTEEQSRALDPAAQEAAAEEVADVLLYLVRLSDVLGIDLAAAAKRKLALNAVRYPVDKARGNRRKYTEL
ncbi:MAG TPA: nucleotide pyrophosphohydrolase [Casimicrobiaceae bacterium]|nr:nucleotide pyrophosphohydrolase [Casimicrobiaceae bacterium]